MVLLFGGIQLRPILTQLIKGFPQLQDGYMQLRHEYAQLQQQLM